MALNLFSPSFGILAPLATSNSTLHLLAGPGVVGLPWMHSLNLPDCWFRLPALFDLWEISHILKVHLFWITLANLIRGVPVILQVRVILRDVALGLDGHVLVDLVLLEGLVPVHSGQL